MPMACLLPQHAQENRACQGGGGGESAALGPPP